MVQDLNGTFYTVRLAGFGVVSLFGFIVLALGASITHWTSTAFFSGYFSFAALGIATGLLTLFSLPPLLWLSINRKGAFSSMICVELGWTWFLWIMWLATGASAASVQWLNNCSTWFRGSAESMCHQTQALTAFSFLNWIILIAYNGFLFFLVIRQHTRGNNKIWTAPILEADYTAAGPAPSAKSVEAGVPVTAQYPPVQQIQAIPAQQQPQQAYASYPQPS